MATLKADFAFEETGYCRRRLCAITVYGIILSGCAVTPAQDVTATRFTQYQVDTVSANRQTVLAGFFLGGSSAEIAVVHVDENDNRHVRLYGLDDGAWVSVLNATLGPEVLFVDVANIDGRDCLITYDGHRLNWFDPESATERALAQISISYQAVDKSAIPHLDITRDVNRDGRDDLVVPDIDGFWISTQLNNGSFADAVQLGPPEPYGDEPGLDATGIVESRNYREMGITAWNLSLYMARIHEVDYNQDGRGDLLFWNEDHFDVYAQNERGLFESIARTFTVDVPFDSDGAYSRVFDFTDEGALSLLFGFNENSTRTVLHSFRDLNGDQVTDLITLTLSGRTMLKQRSVYNVHFGTSTANGIVFSRDVNTSIQRRGKATVMAPWGYSSQRFQDFDGDGDVDILFTEVKVGIGGMGRALVGNSVAMDLEFHRFEDGVYADKPAAIHKIRPAFRPFGGRKAMFFPVAQMEDMNGDGYVDLLVSKSQDELHIISGVPAPELLARESKSLAVGLPAYPERNVTLFDLNRDKKQDLIVHYPSATGSNRLIVLIHR